MNCLLSGAIVRIGGAQKRADGVAGAKYSFGMLVVYCLKNIQIFQGTHGIPEMISVIITGILHIWKRQMLFSITGGTVCYMLLIHFIFQNSL